MPAQKIDEFQTFLDQESERLDKNRKEQMENKGYKEFWKPVNGSHEVFLYPVLPRATKSQWGDKMVFRLRDKEQKLDFDWSINPNSPLYRQLINVLRASKGKGCEVKVLKSGAGMGTRWELV